MRTPVETPDTPVAVAVDGTDGSEGALRFASREAMARGCPLRIVHVVPLAVPTSPLQPYAATPAALAASGHAVVQRASRDAREQVPGLVVSTSLQRDTRVHGIIRGADAAQLLVLGRETRHGLERLLAGSTTAGVVARAHCPVVAVPQTWQPRAGTPCVVVGLHEPDRNHSLLAAAFAWAKRRAGTVRVVHAWTLADVYRDRIESRTHATEWEAAGRAALEDAIAAWRMAEPGILVETQVAHGQSAAALSAAADDADLVMVRRAHQHRPWDHLGPTVRAVLQASPIPVEVVPTPVDEYLEEPVAPETGVLVR